MTEQQKPMPGPYRIAVSGNNKVRVVTATGGIGLCTVHASIHQIGNAELFRSAPDLAARVERLEAQRDDLRRALSVALKLYETDQLTRLGEHLKASVDPWTDRDAEVYGPDMEDER